MRKRSLTFLIVMVSAVALLGFTGCGKKPEPKPEPKPTPRAPRQEAPKPQVQEPVRRVEERATVPADLKLSNIFFDFDKSDVRSDQRSAINRNAELLKRYPSVSIRIEGHCDERGSDEYNIALGNRRAEATKRYLVEYGIAGNRIQTISYGESRPVDPGHTEAAWTKNRRSEFVITAR